MAGVSASTKDTEIGRLEADVLRALNSVGEASAGEIVEELKPRRVLAYTTVSTTLDRLHKKGLVLRRSASGRPVRSTSTPSLGTLASRSRSSTGWWTSS